MGRTIAFSGEWVHCSQNRRTMILRKFLDCIFLWLVSMNLFLRNFCGGISLGGLSSADIAGSFWSSDSVSVVLSFSEGHPCSRERESLVYHVVRHGYEQGYKRTQFGAKTRTGWTPDLLEHTLSLSWYGRACSKLFLIRGRGASEVLLEGIWHSCRSCKISSYCWL